MSVWLSPLKFPLQLLSMYSLQIQINQLIILLNNSQVIDLDQKLVCIKKADWTHYMYYVIAAELSVLLLLIGKVSYDYWVFKTAGYLPWPASKMPKLPCDWIFE